MNSKIVPYSSEEIKSFKRKLTINILLLIILTPVILIMIWKRSYIEYSLEIFLVFGVLFLLVPIFGIIYVRKYLKDSRKKIYSGIITNKHRRAGIGSSWYYVEVDNDKEFYLNYSGFSEKEFEELKIGGHLEISEHCSTGEVYQTTNISQPIRTFTKADLSMEYVRDGQMNNSSKDQLRKIYKRKITYNILWAIAIGFILLLVATNPDIHKGSVPYLNYISFYLLYIFLLWYFRIRKYYKDLSKGQVRLLKSLVTDKYSSNHLYFNNNWTGKFGKFFYLITGGNKVLVDQEVFNKIDVGSFILIAKGPHTDMIFGMENEIEETE